jgi:hypothetical protein
MLKMEAPLSVTDSVDEIVTVIPDGMDMKSEESKVVGGAVPPQVADALQSPLAAAV